MDDKVSTEVDKKVNAPPEVITVDNVLKEGASEGTPSKSENSITASQARTPKHANKAEKEEATHEELNDTKHRSRIQQSSSHGGGGWSNGPPPGPSSGYPGSGGSFVPPSQPHYDQRMGGSGGGGGQGAFQPRDRHSYPPQQGPPMQVSPGGGRYYYNNSSSHQQRYGPGYDPRGYPADFSQGPSYPQQRPSYSGPPPLYPQQYPPGHGYEGRGGPPASWGPPPSFQHGQRVSHAHHPDSHYSRGGGGSSSGNGGGGGHQGHHGNNANFSRAVSSSFDRSTKSHDKHMGGPGEHSPKQSSHPRRDSGSLADDASWGQLQQVHSVDEDEMRKRLSKRKDPDDNKDVILKRPTSNSSSLTNSPTEGVIKKGESNEDNATKKQSSLDSLSSVASAQEPMDIKSKAPSPDGSAPSLDLMKCPSGTSALLLPHQHSLSQFSLSGLESKMITTKRESDEEERDGVEEDDKSKSDQPAAKKMRTDGKKSSPLSITCSPPHSPSRPKRSKDSKMHQPQAMYPQRKGGSPGFFDKAPSYAYSVEGGPPVQREHPGYPRPGSSASSTITPMMVDGHDLRQPPAVGQMPSWDINAQDSFGATSTGGGNPLMASFSFQHDYQMLGHSNSGDQQMHAPPPPPPPPPMQHQNLESRNQSFEGGHYHGGFVGRSDSMMSYERQMSFDGHGRPGYQGPFPPQAPSWGSAGSYQPGYGHRVPYPPMMRNYSEDSGARTSPPPGPGGMRMMPPNFPPPPEFRAPPSMVNKGGPQNTILTSPYQASPKVGPFGWSKEEDARLTDIMKKYKNPRDWEPIAKEHSRGRSAKECHERWIRYLKPGVRKGQWTDHEDAIVMDVVSTSNEQPFTRWSDLAQRLPGRVGKQIRDRWVNHLNPAINHLPFSREDDLLLWDGHKALGKRWVEISTKYFNNTRSENHIKNRWYSASFKKFISNEFGPDAYGGGKALSPTKKDSPKKKAPTVRPRNIDPEQMEAV